VPVDGGIDPDVKNWIDRVVVPALAREWLETKREETAFLNLKIMRDLRENSEASAEVKP
jgi:hypothetical protein